MYASIAKINMQDKYNKIKKWAKHVMVNKKT